MTVLENAVADLANALEKLEGKLEDSLDAQMADREAVAAAKRGAQTARGHTAEAGAGLTAAISDLKALLDTTAPDAADLKAKE